VRIALLALAVALHAGVGYVNLVSGLAAPIWAVGLLLAIWGALSVFLVRMLRSEKPWPALLVPLAGAAAWFVVVPGLGSLLNWSP
jgi:hypothetical protein